MARALSKSRLMAFRQCPKRLWLQAYQRDLAVVDASAEARFAAGHRVGELARALRPGGHLVGHVDDLPRALRETQEMLKGGDDRILFEAAVASGGVLIRADILERHHQRWRLVEVKSAAGVKEPHIDDVAIQAWVLQRAGLPLDTVALAHIDTGFVYPGGREYYGLFREVDLDDAVQPLLGEIPRWIESAQQTLAAATPEIGVGPQCTRPYECEFLAWCSRDEPEYPVTILPRGGRLVEQLRTEGIRALADVPEARLSNPEHLRIWRATRSGTAEIDPDVASLLSEFPFPRSYLDFETIAPAVPMWAGTRPYQRVPVQWSCHVQSNANDVSAHGALIATGGDPRRAFAEALVGTVPVDGPVFAYNATFERGVLLELMQALPDLAEPLRRIADRLVDLLPTTRSHYYHPAMKGSWSLKAVLPTIAPDLDYADLGGGVQSGADVEAAYFEIINSATDAARRAELEAALITYCERDTLALVRLVEFFERQGRATDD